MKSAAPFSFLFALCFAHLCLLHANGGPVHVRIKNELHNDTKIKIHCQDLDHGLGTQIIVKGMAVEWRTNTSKTASYFCDVEWNESNGFHFEAYSKSRDSQRCKSVCSWRITEKGPLLLNQKSGEWEKMPFNPLPDEEKELKQEEGLFHLGRKCFCRPPKNE